MRSSNSDSATATKPAGRPSNCTTAVRGTVNASRPCAPDRSRALTELAGAQELVCVVDLDAYARGARLAVYRARHQAHRAGKAPPRVRLGGHICGVARVHARQVEVEHRELHPQRSRVCHAQESIAVGSTTCPSTAGRSTTRPSMGERSVSRYSRGPRVSAARSPAGFFHGEHALRRAAHFGLARGDPTARLLELARRRERLPGELGQPRELGARHRRRRVRARVRGRRLAHRGALDLYERLPRAHRRARLHEDARDAPGDAAAHVGHAVAVKLDGADRYVSCTN